MTPGDSNQQNLIVTHAVLTGLTPLIPIPFVDDLILGYLLRSMARRLGDERGRPFSMDEIRLLTDQPKSGCFLGGCLTTIVLYPIKKVLRKVFYFLEWKRATDIISRTYFQGYLIDTALTEGWLAQYGAANVRTALDTVLERHPTSPLTHAVRSVVGQSKGVLANASELLTRLLRTQGNRPNDQQLEDAVNQTQNEPIAQLVSKLQAAIAALPAEHFERMKAEMGRELASPTRREV